MILSDILAVPYGFTWVERDDPFHAIVPACELFEAGFLSHHLIADRKPPRYHVLAKGQHGRADLEALLDQYGGLAMGPHPLHRYYAGDAEELDARSQAAFSAIPFHPTIAAVMDRARQVPLPPRPVAQHLRA